MTKDIFLNQNRRKYKVRPRFNPMVEYDETEFVKRFRFSKADVRSIYRMIDGDNTLEPLVEGVASGFSINGITKLTIALRFYATADFYQTIGDLFGVSKSIVNQIIEEVSYLISTKMRERYISMPSTVRQMNQAKVEFMRLANFPLCIGAIDGTHIPIQSFGGNDGELYRNRKTVFSLNVQFIVSADEKVLDVVARWPGSAHDSNIFTHSTAYRRFVNGEFPNCVLVADSAYPAEDFISKLLREPQEQNQRIYQDNQIKARNVAERVNGQIKRAFPILKYGMNFKKKDTAQDVVVSCVILHNMRKMDKPKQLATLGELGRIMNINQRFALSNTRRIQDFIVNDYYA